MAIKDRVTGLQHLGLPSADLAATLNFFESLGFERIYSTVDEGNNVVFLQLGNVVIETYDSTEAAGKPGAWEHVAIDVDDIDAVYEEIVAAGRYTICEDCKDGVRFLPFWEKGTRFFTIMGPGGEKVEFSQIL